MNFVVDTHALIWHLENARRLGVNARKALESAESTLIVSTMSLAEITYLYRKDRVTIDVQEVLQKIQRDPRCILHPIDELVILRMPDDLEIHDGIIVATALISLEIWGEETALITKDKHIIRSGKIETVW